MSLFEVLKGTKVEMSAGYFAEEENQQEPAFSYGQKDLLCRKA